MPLARTAKEIQAKRSASSVPSLRAKRGANGRAGKDRAFVRVGKTQTAILIGADDCSDWDIEELRQGRRRSKNGSFSGMRPVVVALKVHDELVRRTLDTANQLLLENLEAGVQVLTDIAKDAKADNKDRLTAIKMMMDRAMGKEPVTVNIGQEKKWQAAITHSIVSMPAALVDPTTDEGDEEDDGKTGD